MAVIWRFNSSISGGFGIGLADAELGLEVGCLVLKAGGRGLARRQLLLQPGRFRAAVGEFLGQVVAQALQCGDIAQQRLHLGPVGIDDLVGIFQLGIDLGLGAGVGRRLVLGIGLSCGKCCGDGIAVRRRGGELLLHLVAIGSGLLKLRRQLRDGAAQIGVGGLLQRQHVAQLAHLLAELRQCLVAARKCMAQEDLGDDEDHEGEDDDHEQRAEHVDIAGPDVEMAARSGRHGGYVPSGARPRRRARRWCGPGP
jgi:hypothetical protein